MIQLSWDGAITLGKKPGKDVHFEGLNWDTPALAQIKEGTLTISMGSFYDRWLGYDFTS